MANPKKSTDDLELGESQQELAARQAKAAGTTVEAQADKQKIANLALQSERVKPAEGKFNTWHVDADHGITKADLERTSFWVHNAKLFRPRDHVHVYCVDNSFYAWLIVTGVGPKDVKMHVRCFDNLDPIEPGSMDVPLGYSIVWRGSIAKFGVLRGTDLIREGFEHRSEASRWIGSHVQSLAR
jgi:hypothetical protein